MRTTLDIDSALLESVVEATGEKTKSRAVNAALQDYIRRMKIEELRSMAGKLPVDDTRAEQRVADQHRQALLDGLRVG